MEMWTWKILLSTSWTERRNSVNFRREGNGKLIEHLIRHTEHIRREDR